MGKQKPDATWSLTLLRTYPLHMAPVTYKDLGHITMDIFPRQIEKRHFIRVTAVIPRGSWASKPKGSIFSLCIMAEFRARRLYLGKPLIWGLVKFWFGQRCPSPALPPPQATWARLQSKVSDNHTGSIYRLGNRS